MSCFFMELMAAPGTMDLFFSCASGQPQQGSALRAFEIFILFHSLQAHEKLFCFQDCVLEEAHELPVFFLPFVFVFGEEPEYGPAVQPVVEIDQPVKSGERDDDLYDKACNDQRHPQLVRSVAVGHKPGKSVQQAPE